MKADTVRKYLKPYKVMSRWTTFNGALQAGLAVPEAYDPTRHAEALTLLGQDPEGDLSCVYCGGPAATWDHLENNVKKGRFSGFGHRIFNLVPACRTCNERKGGKHWKVFLDKLEPPDKAARVRVIGEFAKRNAAENFGWDEIEREFPELAKHYDLLRREIHERLRLADQVAIKIRAAVSARLGIPEPLATRAKRRNPRRRA